MSTPYTLRSRWWTFTVEGYAPEDLTEKINKLSPVYAHWWSTDSVAVAGYIYYRDTKPAPLPKKPWIYSATFKMSTKEKIHNLYGSPPANALSYGATPVINWSEPSPAVIESSKQEYMKSVCTRELENSKPQLPKLKQPYYTLPNGNTFHKDVLNAMLAALLAVPPEAETLAQLATDILHSQTIGWLAQILATRGFNALLTLLKPSRTNPNKQIES